MLSRTLRFATFLAPNVYPVYRAVADFVARQLSRPVELFVGESYEQLGVGVDVAFVCGLPYVTLVDGAGVALEPLAAPVLAGDRYGGRPVYYSDVVVRRDSPFRTFADLRGRSWCYNEPSSHSGYGVVRYHLARLGETGGYFGRVVETGFHERSIRLVASGLVDASAVDSQVLAVALRDDPELAARVRTVASLGPSTIQPVVASRRLPLGLRDDLRGVLCAIGDDPASRPALAHGFVERFVPVTDASYDDIRAMARFSEGARCGDPATERLGATDTPAFGLALS